MEEVVQRGGGGPKGRRWSKGEEVVQRGGGGPKGRRWSKGEGERGGKGEGERGRVQMGRGWVIQRGGDAWSRVLYDTLPLTWDCEYTIFSSSINNLLVLWSFPCSV